MTDALAVLTERGFIKQCSNMELLEKLLKTRQLTVYAGFDPTGPSLHAGHLIPLLALAHLQRCGHKVIALVGGGTAMVGDPTGKTEMRRIQTREQIQANALSIGRQIARIVTIDGANGIMADNADWLANLNYIDFLRDIGRHFSVNRMLSFETYKMRLETGLSFIEFNYQLLQSYDFLILNQRYSCSLQIGGDDQWGNIVAGADLVRRVEGKEVFGLTFPLITRSDGKKMGKTESGALFLDAQATPVFEFYQYWRNVPDEDTQNLLLLYTLLPVERIQELCSAKDQSINTAKEILAYELTAVVHGTAEADKARAAAQAAFGSEGAIDRSGIPSVEISCEKLRQGISAAELFALTDLCASKAEARRLIAQGGALINSRKVENETQPVSESWADNGELLLKAGKKRFFRIIVR